jgi:hypothetical protein
MHKASRLKKRPKKASWFIYRPVWSNNHGVLLPVRHPLISADIAREINLGDYQAKEILRGPARQLGRRQAGVGRAQFAAAKMRTPWLGAGAFAALWATARWGNDNPRLGPTPSRCC